MPDVLPKNSENANKQPVTPASRLRYRFWGEKGIDRRRARRAA